MESPYHNVCIVIDGEQVRGVLFIPAEVKAIVILSAGLTDHQSNGKYSVIIRYLHEKSYGTLLVNPITIDERRKDYSLYVRLSGVKAWLENNLFEKQIKVGFFGAEVCRLYGGKTFYKHDSTVDFFDQFQFLL